jgi:hypothetical protein
MTTGRLAVLALAALLAFGGLGTAFALDGGDDDPGSAQPIELRKDDASAEVLTEEDDGDPEPTGDGDRTRGDDGTGGGNNTGDGDRTRGNDGTRGGDNTGDRDATAGNDGTRGGDNTGDGDATWGNDGTGGGDNSYVAPAAPAGGGYGDSGGGTTG